MSLPSSKSVFTAFLYGSASTLLIFNVFFLIEAVVWSNFVPVVPIIAGALTAAGLLLVLLAEGHARKQDQVHHRQLARVSHQLETPLASLQNDIEQLLSNQKKLPAETRLTLKHMETRTLSLLDSIRHVFLLLRAQEGPIAQDVRLYNLCAVVTESIDREKGYASARNVELVHQMHCEDAPVRIDRQLLLIVLTQLITNAVTYTITPGLINIAVQKDKQFAKVVIQDRGVGIAEHEAGAIWQPFVRGQAADRFNSTGMGVGLTLSHLIVKELGGTLSAKQRTDSSGMQFEIKLPLAAK